MRRLVTLLVVLSACGDDEPPPPARPQAPTQQRGIAPAADPGKAAQPLVLKPKVEKMYRKEFSAADFQPDATGDVNRDPFFSYLVAPVVRPGEGVPVTDECADRKVAEKYAYPDMRLIGIVMRGTKNFAMFKDPTGLGQVVYQGDCLAKEKAKVIEITPSCVRIEIRGVAPPGAPAPPAHEDKRCLHPDDIEIQ